jgi:hypothetical protein
MEDATFYTSFKEMQRSVVLMLTEQGSIEENLLCFIE